MTDKIHLDDLQDGREFVRSIVTKLGHTWELWSRHESELGDAWISDFGATQEDPKTGRWSANLIRDEYLVTNAHCKGDFWGSAEEARLSLASYYLDGYSSHAQGQVDAYSDDGEAASTALVAKAQGVTASVARVFYTKPARASEEAHFSAVRNYQMGSEFCEKQKQPLPTWENLTETHTYVMPLHMVDYEGCSLESAQEFVFRFMQGENWSPNGEARELLESVGLAHTSMSTGDVVKLKGRLFMVDIMGWKELEIQNG